MYDIGSKSELIVYLVRDSVAIFKKEISLLINSNQLIVSEISRIDIIVCVDYDQGTFQFSIKLLFFTKSEKY